MQFRQRAVWIALFIYLACGFFCLMSLLQLTYRDTLLRIQAPNSGLAAKLVPSNVSSVVLICVVVLLYLQGFAILLVCTWTDTKSSMKHVFPFVLCTMWGMCWKKSGRDDHRKKFDVAGEPVVLEV